MNRDFEKVSLEIYDKLFELGKQIYGDRDKQKPFLQDISDFEKKWIIKIGAENIQFESDVINELELTKSKLFRKIKKCVIFGSVSSGKSTLINALLAKEILPTGFGSTSNCFVEITASSTNENYLVVNNEKKSIEELKELNNIKSKNHLKNGSLITMYYKNECELLKDNIVIIDAPGSNSTFLQDNSMEEYFKDADVIVLVVNAQSGITTLDEQFFKDFRTRYTKLNVIIVYNFWDFVNPKGDNNLLEEECNSNAKNILCNMLQLTDAEADSSIFFISASERIRIRTSFISTNSESKWEERNKSFECFLNYLQEKMSESLLTKNYKYLKNLKSMVALSINQCQNCVSQMKYKTSDLAEYIKSELDNIEGFKENFNKIISQIIKKVFELLIIQCLILPESDMANENLTNSIVEMINQSLEIIRNTVRDNIKHEDENISTFQQNIFNEIYFPRYFNLNKELNSFNIQDFRDNLMKIKSEIKIYSEITEVLKAVGLGLVGALFGGLAGSTKGAATGFLSGATMATTIFSGNKQDCISKFQSAWKNNDFFRSLMNAFITSLKNTYSEFIDSMVSNVTELITPIENKANKIQNDFKNMAEELQNFQTSFSIN